MGNFKFIRLGIITLVFFILKSRNELIKNQSIF